MFCLPTLAACLIQLTRA